MSIGEILDRAITTYVRRVLPLFVILAITIVPWALLLLAVTPALDHMNGLLAEMNRLPPSDVFDRNRLMMQAFSDPGLGKVGMLFLLWPMVFSPLSRTAVFVFADAALDAAPMTIAGAYRESFRRWGPQIVAGIGFGAIAVCALIVLFVALILVVVLVVLIGGRGPAAGVIALILALPLVAVVFFATALANVGYELTSVSVALEETNPFRAIGNGLRRTFERSLWRRTFAVAAAFFAVELIGGLVLLGASALFQSFPGAALAHAIVNSIGQIVIEGVLAVFVVAYSRDVRLRREGLDLLRAANEPAPLP